MAGLRGRTFVVSPADPYADNEVKLVSLIGLAVLVTVSGVGYFVRKTTLLGPLGRNCILAAIWLGTVMAPFLVLNAHGPFRSMMAHFTLSFLGVCGSFRCLELILGTGPEGFDHSAKAFMVYFTSPAEVLFAKDGAFRKAPAGQLTEIVLRLAVHMLLGAVIMSVGKATDFVPLLEPGSRPVEMAWYGLPRSLPALWLQAGYVYCMLTTAMLMHRVPCALVGIDTVDPMGAPLLLSTSIRDFWGRRWNLVIHRLMKRTFFTPLVGCSRAARHLGGALSFLMSGLFHEYMWLAVNWFQLCPEHYVPGQVLLFFMLQFALCAAEAMLANTAVGRLASMLPRLLRTVGTTLAILPLGPLFLHGLHGAGMMAQCAAQGATLDLLPKGADLSGVSQTVPFDWAFLVVAVFVTLGLRLRERLREQAARPGLGGDKSDVLRVATVDGTLIGG